VRARRRQDDAPAGESTPPALDEPVGNTRRG